MAYEFKKLSDVKLVETPADSANVLIEENGVIKKAPKSAVGGAGSTADIIIIDNSNGDTNNVENIYFKKGSYGDIVNAWENRTLLNVEVIDTGDYSAGSFGYMGGVYKGYVSNYRGEINVTIVYQNSCFGCFGYKRYTIFEDDSFNVYAGIFATN